MKLKKAAVAAFIGAMASATLAGADEEPKNGGTLTYMIPADAPPSFDAHREGTFATVHSAAPFYSAPAKQIVDDSPPEGGRFEPSVRRPSIGTS